MKPSIQLNNIISTDKVKIFDTNQGVFIADVESSKTFNINDDLNTNGDIIYNRSNMLDVLRNTMIQNYYEIDDFDGQTFRSPLPRNEWTNTPSDFAKQYNADDLPYQSITQMGGYGFLLSDETIDGLRDESFNTSAEIYETINSPVNTYVYPPSDEIVLCGVPEDSGVEYGDWDLSGTMIPLYNLSGISYNYLGEVDCVNRYFNYVTPTFYANHTNTKTHLNQNYDTGSMVTSSVNVSSVSATMINTRVYNKIGSSDDLLYMTYKHSRDYTSLPTLVDGREYNDYSFETLSSAHLTDINMSGYSTIIPDSVMVTGVSGGPTLSSGGFTSGGTPITGWVFPEPEVGVSIIETPIIPSTGDEFANKFNYIESIGVNTLGGLGKYDTQSVHKTNVYSINIQNANIDSSIDITDDVRNKMKKSISNIIKNMVESCTPVNTQLIDINWNGE